MLVVPPDRGGRNRWSIAMTPLARTLATCAFVLACATTAQDGAAAPSADPPGAPAGEPGSWGDAKPWIVESCVSPDSIALQRSDPWVALTDSERAGVFEQMMRRYPALQRDGLVPAQIVLWRPPGRAWVYVTMLANPARADQACFTATVTANALDITTALLQKYFALRSAAAHPGRSSA
jgi:hypothetical protein